MAAGLAKDSGLDGMAGGRGGGEFDAVTDLVTAKGAVVVVVVGQEERLIGVIFLVLSNFFE